jgi:DNA-binding PadR family transcriptional regulator
MKRTVQDFLPLESTRYFIMSSLFARSRHPYGVLTDIRQLTGFRLVVPTMYENFKRLKQDGLIKKFGIRGAFGLQAYQLTELGVSVLLKEEEFRETVTKRTKRIAKQRLQAP